MTAKDYLKQVKGYATIINAKEYQLAERRKGQVFMSAIEYDRERVMASTSQESKYILQSESLIALEQDIKRLKEEYYQVKDRILEEIYSLGTDAGLYEEILDRRYLRYQKIEYIADEMGYHPNYISNCHAEALKLFEDKVIGGK